MKEIVKKVEFLESMILKFAKSKLNEANDAFAKRHGYDLRKTNNNDHLVFRSWEIEGENIILSYREVTPHDCPYGVELEYKLSELSICI